MSASNPRLVSHNTLQQIRSPLEQLKLPQIVQERVHHEQLKSNQLGQHCLSPNQTLTSLTTCWTPIPYVNSRQKKKEPYAK